MTLLSRTIRILVLILWIINQFCAAQDEDGSVLLFIIEQLNETRVNLTCLAFGKTANNAIFLNTKSNFEYGDSGSTDNEILIPLSKNARHFNLPVVLDKQWESFQWRSLNESLRLFKSEHQWISFRQAQSFEICISSTKNCIDIKDDSQNIWGHIQIHFNGTDVFINNDSQKELKLTRNKNAINLQFSCNYRLHDFTMLQHDRKIEFDFQINNLQWKYIEISFLICYGCKIYIKLENSSGERVADVHTYENSDKNLHWRTSLFENYFLKERSDTITNELTLVANLESALSITQTFMVLRNLIIGYGEREHYISKIVPLQNLDQYSCGTVDPFTVIKDRKANFTKKNINKKVKIKSKICDQEMCYCSIGSLGKLCEKDCNIGFWDDCTTICDCCDKFNSCDSVTGKCLYPKEDCSKSRSVDGINILKTTANNISANVLLSKENIQENINAIRLEYGNTEVIKLSQYLSLDDDYYYFDLNNLAPSTTYEIRAALCMDEICFNENVFRMRMKTRCRAPLDSEYFINATSSKITLNLDKGYIENEDSCARVCGINMKNSKEILKSFHTKIEGLQPYTVYNISLWCDGVKINTTTIRTAATVPSKVINLQQLNNTIFWSAPKIVNGPISNYMLHLIRYGSILCNGTLVSSKFKVNGTSFDLPELEAFSKYTISVQACNKNGCGQNKTVSHDTLPSDDIWYNERPGVFYLNGTHFIIEFDNCDDSKGPFVYFTTEFACMDAWCSNAQRIVAEFKLEFVKNITLYEYPIKDQLLIPYTRYKTNTKVRRNKAQLWIGNNETRTPEKCPPTVRNLSIYSRSNNSMSLRWKQPYPPHGILKKYTFSYSYGMTSMHYDKHLAEIKKCDLWDDRDYFCSTLKDLQINPSLILTATNEHTSQCNSGVYIANIELKESASDPPHSISAKWTNETMNSLLIKWKHPNETNGAIKYFKLQFVEVTKNFTVTQDVAVKEEIMNYSFLWTNFNDSSKYNLTVIPVNQFKGISASLEELITTPPPYPEINENIIYTINGSICYIDMPMVNNILLNNSYVAVILYCQQPSKNNQKELSADILINLEIKEDKADICATQIEKYIQNYTIILNLKDHLPFALIEDLLHDNKFKIEIMLINKLEQHTRSSKYTAVLSGMSPMIRKDKQSKAVMFPINIEDLNYWHLIGFVAFVLIVILTGLIMKYGIGYLKRLRNANVSESIYDTNLTRNEESKLVPISNIIKKTEFGQYLYAAIENGNLYEEYNSVPMQLNNTFSIKNKRSRNKQKQIKIDWSIISGYKCTEAYIAMQNPLRERLSDFWNVIFAKKVRLIVMLNGDEEYVVYWPSKVENNVVYGSTEIKLKNEFHHSTYIERFFEINDGFVHYELVQIQYFVWPKYDVPKYCLSLCQIMRKLHEIHDYKNPAVIHSSSGVGRTGALILCDYILRMVQDIEVLDFLLVLNNLRREQMHFVETKEQYQLAHILVLDYLFTQKSIIYCNDSYEDKLRRICNNEEIITNQFEYLQKMTEIDSGHYGELNRDGLKSSKFVRVEVNNNEDEAKIYVVRADFKEDIGRFWENVVEANCSIIVVLEKLEIPFYPTQLIMQVDTNNNVSINFCECTNNGWYDKLIIKFKLQHSDKESVVEILQIIDTSIYQDISKFNELYKGFRTCLNKNTSALITCLDGSKLSGLLIAYHLIIDKLLNDQICDVVTVIRHIRYKNPKFIADKNQLKFIYSAILGATDMFKLYHYYHTVGQS